MNYYNRLSFSTALMGGLVSCFLILASAMPWFTVNVGIFSSSVNGIDSSYNEGYITLTGGIIMLLAVLFGRRLLFGGIACCLVLITFYDLTEIFTAKVDTETFGTVGASPSIGIFIAIAASVFGVILAIALWEYAPKPTTQEDTYAAMAQQMRGEPTKTEFGPNHELEYLREKSMKMHPSNP